MSDPAARPNDDRAESAPPAPAGPARVRVDVAELPKAFHALACALGEAGVGGQQLPPVFANGVRATCAGCGMNVTGSELSDLVVAGAGDGDHRLPPKLDRLRLGYCPRNGCDARYYTLELGPGGTYSPAAILDRARSIMAGERQPLIPLGTSATPATRQASRRLALVALGTLFAAFVAYRLIYYRSQLIPFVEPKSPFQVEPASLPPPP